MKIFISYHRVDEKYKEKIEGIIKEYGYDCYSVPKTVCFDGEHHQTIKDKILKNMKTCDILLCIVGKKTYSRPHVDWELYEALKGGVKIRKGLIVVMLESRDDNKNDIDYSTFPPRISENEDYAVIEQYCTIHKKLPYAIQTATENRSNKYIKICNLREPMKLRDGLYYDLAT